MTPLAFSAGMLAKTISLYFVFQSSAAAAGWLVVSIGSATASAPSNRVLAFILVLLLVCGSTGGGEMRPSQEGRGIGAGGLVAIDLALGGGGQRLRRPVEDDAALGDADDAVAIATG